MPVQGWGWELLVMRLRQERRGEEWRTIGTYQIYRNGTPDPSLSGMTVETEGPGDNRRLRNKRRIEARSYPLMTQAGVKYRTVGYSPSLDPNAMPRPGLQLGSTDARQGILIHPGLGFLLSRGCLHPTRPLHDASDDIDYLDSRTRTIALIDDLARYTGPAFPSAPDRPIPNAWVRIEGEP